MTDLKILSQWHNYAVATAIIDGHEYYGIIDTTDNNIVIPFMYGYIECFGVTGDAGDDGSGYDREPTGEVLASIDLLRN